MSSHRRKFRKEVSGNAKESLLEDRSGESEERDAPEWMTKLHCMQTLALNSIKYEPLKHVNDKNMDLIG